MTITHTQQVELLLHLRKLTDCTPKLDEIGPRGASTTIDFDTVEKDGSFTLRERDSMQQRRIGEADQIAR